MRRNDGVIAPYGGIKVHRYDPDGESPTASVYSLRPVEGLTELATAVRSRSPRPATGPPDPVRPQVRQPQVGSVARVAALLLADDALQARFECDGVIYAGPVAAAQPSVGEWLTVVTVGLHGQGLYVDLAGSRVVTVQNLTEISNGLGCIAFYDQRRAAGDLHHQALRALGNRRVGILHGCPRHRQLYNENTAWAHRRPADHLAA